MCVWVFFNHITYTHMCLLLLCVCRSFLITLHTHTHTHTHTRTQPQQQRQRRQPVPHAPNVAPSRDLVKAVAAVAVVLGSETAEVLAMSRSIARGMRASRHAKHGRSSRQPSADSRTLLSSETPLMALTWQTPHPLCLQIRSHSRPLTHQHQCQTARQSF